MPDAKPRFPIRRFDVFADYQLVQNQARGMPKEQAKGRAIWAAKVVAGGQYGAAPAAPSSREHRREAVTPPEEEEEFRSLGGVPQTDRTFEKEIVDRMGPEFYREVFHPAIEQAFREGKRYEDIRDAIRKDWK